MQLPKILSTITESPNATSVTDEEDSIYDELSIDQLFEQLKDVKKPENTAAGTSRNSEFDKIKQSIASLPKLLEKDETLSGIDIKSKDHQYLISAKGDKKQLGLTNINDPILVKHKADEKKTAGSDWFDMPKGELTAEAKRDMTIIQKRAALDPKRHYRKDKWKVPEYFQFGTIVEGPTEYYSSRLKNKERHATILESVLQDEDTKHYFKRKYDEIQVKKTSGKRGHYKKVKEARRRF